jgi:trans-aconitate methyltransferase
VSSSGLFTGTASCYADFRPRYPRALLDLLVASAPHRGRLVDLGCGTGELARPLAQEFDEVIAVDTEPDMIAVGTAKAAEEGARNITWMVGRAEEIQLAPRSTDLITVGSAFHWMDREHVLHQAHASLAPMASFAVAGSNSTWTGKEPWQQLIVSVIEKVIGPQRRAGHGEFRRPAERHEVVMARNGFSDVVQHGFLTSHTWTLNGILGYLKSTSFASRAVLGDRADEFDRLLADELLAFNPNGTYSEVLPFHALIAHPDRRPT